MTNSGDRPISADVLIGSCIADRYELERLVGRGPKSLVFGARDLRTGGVVGVKLLFDASFSDDQTGTALRASCLEHPGIGRVIEGGRAEEEIPYWVVELIDGHTLAESVERRLLARDKVYRVVIAAARAVGAAHAAGIVHGNVKASNVFVTSSDEVKVVDFGRRESGSLRASRAGSAKLRAMLNVVTEWQAEQSTIVRYGGSGSSTTIDPRDDVKALGLLLLELLTPGADPALTATERIAALARVPELGPVIDVIRASSSGAIGQRAASASEFADQLAEAVACTPPAPCEEPAPPPSTWVDALIGRVIGERYRVEEVIGRGTTSVVFRARHLELGSPVAVKVLSPSASGLDSAVHDRFRFEAQVLAGLRHPNIISVLDLGTTDDGLRYIAMELLKGETLAALIEREKRLEPTLALRITAQIAEALTQLHERGLIHRDVKPPNIFVVEDSTQLKIAKLMDFGLARAQDGVPSTDEGTSSAGWEDFPRREQHTQRGIILGTGAYMSPELIQNGRLDARSDVYALAVVAYRMLTGVLPFSAKSLPQLLSLHLSAPVEPLHQRAPEAGISAAVERAILRALAKSPADRPESAGQFAMELRAASDESPGQNDVGASPTGTTPPAERSNGESPSVKAAHIQSPMLTMDAGSPQPFEVVRASSRPVDAQPARGEKDLEHASVGSAKAELDSAGGVAVLDDEAHSNPEESAVRSPLSATPTVRSRRQWVSRVTVLGIVSAALILASYAMFVRTRAEPARVEAPGTNAAGPVLRHADQTAREEAPPPATVSAPAPQPPSSTTSTTTLPPEPSARRAAHGSAPDTDKGRTTRTKTKSKRKSVGNADELKTPLWR